MECTELDSSESRSYVHALYERAVQEKVPLTGTIDLTYQCSLRCVHCYLGPQVRKSERRSEEMATEKVFSLIDELVEAGCLFLSFSGGDPLLHKDFHEIYRHARKKGLILSILTNAVTITHSHVELFREYPPRCVDISLYGATQETYEDITQVAGSYHTCMNGIRALLDAGIPVHLKTPLLTLNKHELREIEKLSESMGCKFRFDVSVTPRLDGDQTPLQYRLPAEDAVHDELRDTGVAKQWAERLEAPDQHQDDLYSCYAGKAVFHIDAYGELRPCLMARKYGYSLHDETFLEGWRGILYAFSEERSLAETRCGTCKKQRICSRCPGSFALETGSEQVPPQFACDLAEARLDMIVSEAL